MAKKSILFTAFEATPFIKTGGLGDVAGSLPASIKSKDIDIRVILPKLGQIPEKYVKEMKYVKNYGVPLGWRMEYCGLFEMEYNGVTIYFLDNERYFMRDQVYGEGDDAERVAFFSKAVLETIGQIKFKPDIIHCNDWHTALVPVFLHEHYNGVFGYDNIKTVFTIHNLKFQGAYDPFIIGDILGLNGTPAEPQLMHNGAVNFLKGGVIYSDMVTTVSPTYAENICTPEYGEGLEDLFNSIRYKLRGIINGIDYDDLNPATDPNIAAHYDVKNLSNKELCKLELQKELGLDVNLDVPIFAIVSRLTDQKGMDMVAQLLPEFADMDMQVAILGTGDKHYEGYFQYIGSLCPNKIAVRIAFSESLSRKFYSGADVFMMPSVFEPCGLAQMMSMRYGTLPLVRETGGLKDTVDGYWGYGDQATGFDFLYANAYEMKNAVYQALDIWYNDKGLWNQLQINGMTRDFSWPKSANEYIAMYDELIG